MAAKDKYHEHVKEALVKDGWTITDDPYYLNLGKVKYEIDLGAEKRIGATKDKWKKQNNYAYLSNLFNFFHLLDFGQKGN